MFKLRTATIKVKVEYIDVNGDEYYAISYVDVNDIYEVDSVRFSAIEHFNKNEEPVNKPVECSVIEQLETIAGALALEKVHPEDFATEDEL